MKVIELLKLLSESLKVMSKNGVRVKDYQFVETYENFLNMRSNKVKYRTAIKVLSEEKKVSERTLERIFKRLAKIVK